MWGLKKRMHGGLYTSKSVKLSVYIMFFSGVSCYGGLKNGCMGDFTPQKMYIELEKKTMHGNFAPL